MLPQPQHKDAPPEHNHTPFAWIVADEAERNALTVTADQVGKRVWQKDNDTEWTLKSADPVEWVIAAPVQSVAGRTGDVTVSKSDVGLGNADNTSDANKPVSTAQQAALNEKVDKVAGKGLSAEDYTATEKQKLAGIEAGATQNATDAQLRERSTHTGTQPASTITGLAPVATSGDYNALTNKPDLSALEEVTVYASQSAFPATGESNKIYIAEDTGYVYRWNGSTYTQLTDQTAIWGQIGGDLASQTDLANALAGKVDKVTDKALSSNDYTDTEKSKLAGIESGATADQTKADIDALNIDADTVDGKHASDFDAAGAASSSVTAHENASNPHPQYTTESEVSDLAPKAPGVLDGLRRSVEASSGGRMTVFYTAKGQPSYFVRQGKFLCEDVAPGGELGTGVHEAFKFGAEEDAEIWVGAYAGAVVNGEGVSQPGLPPGVSIDYDAQRAACQACGPGFDSATIWDWAAIVHWCMAHGFEPRGNTNHGRHHDNRWEVGTRQDNGIPGASSGVGNILGGSGPAEWRHDGTMSGISDMVGNVWEWLSGMKIVDGRVFLSPDNDIPAESGYSDTGFDITNANPWSSLSATGASDALKRALVVPKGANDPTGRLYVNASGERLPLRGGSRSTSGNAGLGALTLTASRAASSTFIGFRPRFRNL